MAKNIIKLTENELRKLVTETVQIMLTEKHRASGLGKGKRIFRKEGGKKQTYYPMNDTGKYADAQGLGSNPMNKVGKIKARPSVAGRQNDGTVLDSGFNERDGYTETEGGMVVRNPKGEEYQIPTRAEFDRKYTPVPGSQPDAEGYSEYNSFDRRNISDPVKHNVYKNMPNWGKGQKQFAQANNGHIVNPGTDDSYFIGDEELKSTHVPANESRIRNIVKKVINEAIYGKKKI
jgi:hypothetical protein